MTREELEADNARLLHEAKHAEAYLRETQAARDSVLSELTAARDENARLTKEYQNSDQDNMRLQQNLDAERGQSNARLQKWQRSEKENARLRSVVESRAARCEACGGGGYVVKVSGKVGQPLNRERIPCPACSDLREALQPKV